ncbi:MAG: ATP-dependent RecD-like DNA helicase [Lachnospiraceae bacterium]|nr:ATP-dependent RecD-like DNA helicase [Lachnospiraceae bacterium]
MEKLTGVIDHFLYRNETNGYGVMELTTEYDDVICVGTLSGYDEGEMVEISGEYVIHPVYGQQLKIESIKAILPTGIMGIERYLSSGIIKGVGPKMAKRIVNEFGEDTFKVIEQEPNRLIKIKGISERIAQSICEQVVGKKEQQDALIFLSQYGISQTMSVKIYDAFGDMIYSIIRDNPYKIIDEVDGIGFKKADEIAKKAGIKVDSEYRIQSGIVYVLTQAMSEGHTYLPMEELTVRAKELLGVETEAIDAQYPNLSVEKKIIIKNEYSMTNCYTSYMYHQELSVASLLKKLSDSHEDTGNIMSDKMVERVEKELGLTLDEMQKKALILAMQSGIMIITGGPGTGKTTTINAIIHCIEKEGLEVMLAAPTGRAAKRMTEATGYEARTVHRMLELNGAISETGRSVYFERNADNPLEADVFIIDEMSMIDIALFNALLKAIPMGARLILVGDVNQLPSVGPGQVLYDLISSKCYPTVTLDHIFRQAKMSDIVVNAHKINRGESIQLGTNSKDFLFLERSDVNVIYKHMIQLITEKLPGYVDATPSQIQVLTPTHIGPLGVEALNRILQKYINPPNKQKKEKEYGDNIFREGDKVMQTKNNYSLEWEILGKNRIVIDSGSGVFNGDVGTIVEIDDSAITVEYDEIRRVRYTYDGLDELELAYAITIHKAQGSEYPAVIMPLLGGPRPLLTRNLLYTGVTRAKRCVMILGSCDTVNTMIRNESEKKRYTGLYMRIKEIMSPQQQMSF